MDSTSTDAAALPYAQDASVNAVLLLQKQVFQFQSGCLQEILRGLCPSKIFINADLKVPSFILNRSLPDELVFQGRSIDNEEMTLLGLLDVSGHISCSSRLSEFMLFMTRIKKVTQPLNFLIILLYGLAHRHLCGVFIYTRRSIVGCACT